MLLSEVSAARLERSGSVIDTHFVSGGGTGDPSEIAHVCLESAIVWRMEDSKPVPVRRHSAWRPGQSLNIRLDSAVVRAEIDEQDSLFIHLKSTSVVGER